MKEKQILAVDDSSTMRMAISMVLRNEGYSVVTAEDGAEALERLRRERFHLIITDLNMPRLCGIELIKAARKLFAHQSTPIVVLTTESEEEKKREGFAAGATAWLQKPFKPKQIIDAVRRVVH